MGRALWHGDVAYFDPPYTKRQYAAYYHLLETIAVGDSPDVVGVTGLRPWQSLASDFCYKTKALKAISTLVAATPARRILLSYSSEGHVTLDALREALSAHGEVKVHDLGAIGRYRPNSVARLARNSGDGVRSRGAPSGHLAADPCERDGLHVTRPRTQEARLLAGLSAELDRVAAALWGDPASVKLEVLEGVSSCVGGFSLR